MSEPWLGLGIALGLGLLVGLQRERAGSAIAGIRTFAIIALLGAVAGMLSHALGAWGVVLIAAGLAGVGALAYIGNLTRSPRDQSPGVTTEAAMLLVYVVGVLVMVGPRPAAVVVGAACALLLHLKVRLHGWARGLTPRDVRAIFQFVAIALVVLPVLPDRAMGPFDAFNPRKVWMLVVLMVGISMLGYVAFRVLGAGRGMLLSGILGGLTSSTATTASFARSVRAGEVHPRVGALVAMLATCVVYPRVLIAFALASAGAWPVLAAPLAALLVMSVLACFIMHARTPREAMQGARQMANPGELGSALLFAGIFAGVLVLTAAAQHFLGDSGTLGVAAIAGTTDMDAITLSLGGMTRDGAIAAPLACAGVLVALASNMALKFVMAWVLGGKALARALWLPALLTIVVALGLAWWSVDVAI